MNKIANVIYSYDAKNDDELNLIIGQQIEIIGVEEEGKLIYNSLKKDFNFYSST